MNDGLPSAKNIMLYRLIIQITFLNLERPFLLVGKSLISLRSKRMTKVTMLTEIYSRSIDYDVESPNQISRFASRADPHIYPPKSVYLPIRSPACQISKECYLQHHTNKYVVCYQNPLWLTGSSALKPS